MGEVTKLLEGQHHLTHLGITTCLAESGSNEWNSEYPSQSMSLRSAKWLWRGPTKADHKGRFQ